MFCSSCGTKNEDAARYCDQCGADLGSMPRPAPATSPAQAWSPPAPAAPPFLYNPREPRAWWYPIGVWVILSAFFLFLDVSTTTRITWSPWPIGILGVFLVGFTLLHRLESWSLSRPRAP